MKSILIITSIICILWFLRNQFPPTERGKDRATSVTFYSDQIAIAAKEKIASINFPNKKDVVLELTGLDPKRIINIGGYGDTARGFETYYYVSKKYYLVLYSSDINRSVDRIVDKAIIADLNDPFNGFIIPSDALAQIKARFDAVNKNPNLMVQEFMGDMFPG